ncbi:MAG: peptidoglycan DD-metalloendopeptidase family protein [Alphaproteobacteria bacterium]
MQRQYNLHPTLKSFIIYIAVSLFVIISSFLISQYNQNILPFNFGSFLNLNNINNESNVLKKISQKEIVEIKIKSGDTLRSILNYTLLSNNEIHQLIGSLKNFYDPKKLFVGQKFIYHFVKDPTSGLLVFNSLTFKTSIDKEISINRNLDGSFQAKETTINFVKNIIRVTGKIENSFLSTAHNLKIPNDSLRELIKAYSYDVDFQRDLQAGDELDVIFEKYYNEQGEFSHNGNIIYASLLLSDRRLNLYQYKNQSGVNEFYNEEGNSIRKELLRTPINIVKISSGFGLRKHPILGYGKMHKGVDFAAPIGTPIIAAGNGRIKEIGRKGSYGNYISIDHLNGYCTAYAHASSFNKSLRKGSLVKQGDVIAYVGTTGMSSGPHLHYEVLQNNKQINPMKLKMSSGIKLAGDELNSFKKQKSKISKLLNNMDNQTELAYEGAF